MNSNRKNKRPSNFKTYVEIDEFNQKPDDVPEELPYEVVEPFQYDGEIVIAQANNVLKFAPLKTNKQGVSGTLFITNFKVSFVTSIEVDKKEEELHHRSLQSEFLRVHDFCLSEVDLVYKITEGSSRKKRLYPNTPLSSRIGGLQIILKNFRVINFSFKFTPQGQDVRIAQALLHHAYPQRIDHLYLSNGKPVPHSGIPEFSVASDWEREIRRTGCPNWRVSKHNEFFNLSSSLPTALVVPRDLLDNQIESAAQHFQGSRPPVWCWGSPSGAALVRMAQISPSTSDKISVTKSMGTLKRRKLEEEALQQENKMMAQVHKCHPKKIGPTIYVLDDILPSLKEVQSAYIKLRELHTPDDPSQYREQDQRYYSTWDSSRWLTYVSCCLKIAQEAAAAMVHNNSSVILQEGEGRDMSAVVSSLVQLLLDPQARTLTGFHTLIQKEWVALSHPFALRLGHTRMGPEGLSAVWLLFLDCVHQISEQHPSALEFTSEYLVSLWHAAHCSLYATFMFNSVNDKFSSVAALQRENPQHRVFMRPVWAWWYEPGDGAYNGKTNSSNGHDSSSEMRVKVWQTFLNVLYVQGLMESLTVGGALQRVSDPMSSAYYIWNRIDAFLGGCTSSEIRRGLDAHTPFVPLKLDPSIKVETSLSRLRPWVGCFGYWLTEPELPLQESDFPALRRAKEREPLWEELMHIYSMLKQHIPEKISNGSLHHSPS
ncbi:myotubularin-related protein 10-B isoform X2 [Oratosquilla oratoria]|uniref:myotubularin-related protein 10-B isoform X2 n=1 Tax=Oratosquilla oratoria TaxID=337810 RepID=UPI003F75C4A0